MTKTATIHRMVMPGHICPYGLKALHLLKSRGFAVEDRWLRSREETDAFKAAHGVKTTPQIFIDGERIGGHDDLRRHLGLHVADPGATSYRPVAALFAMTAAGMLPMLGFALVAGDPIWPTGSWWPLLALAIGSQLIGQGLLAFAVGHLPPLVVGLSLLLQPVILAGVGGLFYGERLTLPDYLGGFALCAALLLVRRAPPRLPDAAGGAI